jgi:hypothetical protein
MAYIQKEKEEARRHKKQVKKFPLGIVSPPLSPALTHLDHPYVFLWVAVVLWPEDFHLDSHQSFLSKYAFVH